MSGYPGLTGEAIYMDYNATTPVDPAVVAAMRPQLEIEFGNPSSAHRYATAPTAALAIARAQVARFIGVPTRPGSCSPAPDRRPTTSPSAASSWPLPTIGDM